MQKKFQFLLTNRIWWKLAAETVAFFLALFLLRSAEGSFFSWVIAIGVFIALYYALEENSRRAHTWSYIIVAVAGVTAALSFSEFLIIILGSALFLGVRVLCVYGSSQRAWYELFEVFALAFFFFVFFSYPLPFFFQAILLSCGVAGLIVEWGRRQGVIEAKKVWSYGMIGGVISLEMYFVFQFLPVILAGKAALLTFMMVLLQDIFLLDIRGQLTFQEALKSAGMLIIFIIILFGFTKWIPW